MSKEAVCLEDVVKFSGGSRRVINRVSFCVAEGESVCIHAGDGKAVLMRLVAGMERPDSGEIFVKGKAVHRMSRNEAACFRGTVLGVSLHSDGFFPGFTMWENVALPLALQGVSFAGRKRAAAEQMGKLGLRHISGAYPNQISAYESKMASLARALITGSKILLFDDITGGLSERDAGRIVNTVGELCCRDMTVVFFTGGESDPGFTDRQIVCK